MAGLSATLFDSASIDLIGDHSAAAKSGSSISGRALSDTAHGSTAGLRYFEVDLTGIRSSGNRWFGVGLTDSTSSLTSWIGAGTDYGIYLGAPSASSLGLYVNGAGSRFIGESLLAQLARIGVWVDTSTRRVWITSRPRGGYLVGTAIDARPDLGVGQSWTMPGTGALRVAITPGFGSVGDRNVARFRSRHAELMVGERYSAQPWDARQITISGTVNTDHAPVGSQLRVAWFDHASPHEITTAPTSVTTITVGAGGAYSVTIWTSLDPGQAGSLLLMRDDGTVLQARSHYRPVTVS